MVVAAEAEAEAVIITEILLVVEVIFGRPIIRLHRTTLGVAAIHH